MIAAVAHLLDASAGVLLLPAEAGLSVRELIRMTLHAQGLLTKGAK